MEQALLRRIVKYAPTLRIEDAPSQGARMSDTFERKVMTPAERAARKVFREAEASKAMTEHERAQKAFHQNRERLKALRLAREAAAAKAE
jgi:hypothetical protein